MRMCGSHEMATSGYRFEMKVDKLPELLQVIWPAGNNVKFRKGVFTRVLMRKMNQMTHAGKDPFQHTLSQLLTSL